MQIICINPNANLNANAKVNANANANVDAFAFADDDDAIDAAADNATIRQHGKVGSALMLSISHLSSRQLNCKWKYTEKEFTNTLTPYIQKAKKLAGTIFQHRKIGGKVHKSRRQDCATKVR